VAVNPRIVRIPLIVMTGAPQLGVKLDCMSAVAEVKARALEMSAVICGVRFIFVYRLVAMAIHARMALCGLLGLWLLESALFALSRLFGGLVGGRERG